MQAIIVRSSSLSDMFQRLRGGILMPEPLDYLVQKAFVFLLGDAQWILRLHAALFGTMSRGRRYGSPWCILCSSTTHPDWRDSGLMTWLPVRARPGAETCSASVSRAQAQA